MEKNFYRAFEERYRGSRGVIKKRLTAYAPFLLALKTQYPAATGLDLGCGRGEWLELLHESGIEAQGVDLDQGMLDACKDRGLKVHLGDALDYLGASPADSLAIISAFHVVEHLPFPKLSSLIADALSRLQPGGLLILETPNPENFNVACHTFHLDPTHTKPLPPNLLSFLCEFHGFETVKVLRLQAPENAEANQNPNLLQVLTESSPDYAIVAQKKPITPNTAPLSALFRKNYGIQLSTLASRFDNNQASLRNQVSALREEQLRLNLFWQESYNQLRLHIVGKSYSRLNAAWHTHLYRGVLSLFVKSEHHLPTHFGRAFKSLCGDPRFCKNTSPYATKSPTQGNTPFLIKPAASRTPTFFIDVSITSQNDYRTGIQRVVRAVTLELLNNPPRGFLVQPIYQISQDGRWCYYNAHQWTRTIRPDLELPAEDTLVEFQPGDTYFIADLTGGMVSEAERLGFLRSLRDNHVKIGAIVYDLLPVFHPQFFPPSTPRSFLDWLHSVSRSADFLVCISKTVQDNLALWLHETKAARPSQPAVGFFRLGGDIKQSIPSTGLPTSADALLEKIKSAPTFIMVGMLEPRKGHADILDAFNRLWDSGININLILIGKSGWSIDSLIEKIQTHPQYSQRLYHIKDASDEFLDIIYNTASCLIAASYDEGFGLPLVEAAQKGIPIIARDIPIFREVAQDHAHYLQGSTPTSIAASLCEWLDLHSRQAHPDSKNIKWLTWKESTKELLTTIKLISPDSISPSEQTQTPKRLDHTVSL